MTITYYLLRSKDSALGDGSYLGTDPEGKPAMVSSNAEARRFPSLETAEQTASETGESFGGFEIEVRTSES